MNDEDKSNLLDFLLVAQTTDKPSVPNSHLPAVPPSDQHSLVSNGGESPSSVSAEGANINAAILRQQQQDNQERLRNLQSIVVQMAANQQRGIFLQPRDWLILAIVLFLQTFLQYFLLSSKSS